MKKTQLLMLLLIFSCNTSAQLMNHVIAQSKPADSIDIAYYSTKKPWITVGIVGGFNIGLWGVDRFILKGHYAYINFKTMKTNLTHGFVWDNDQLSTNMFAHPYTGNLYFNAARSNGYNYWASLAFATGGSLMWEEFMENEYPSLNDLIATPIGGAALGEITYRASDLVLDDRKRGSSRFGSELACLAIAPTRELTRLLNGDAFRVRQTSGRQFGTPSVSMTASLGLRALELKDELFDKGTGLAMQFAIGYGDRFDADGSKPFDQFNILTQFNLQKGQPVIGQINIVGRLAATELINNQKDFLSLGIYQHFDYFDSDTISSISNEIPYKLATPAAVGGGIVYQNKRFKNWHFDLYGHINAIILGASLSDHYIMDNRNYNIGSGFGWKSGLNISYKDIVGLSWLYEGYRVYTWKGYPIGEVLNPDDYKEMDVQGDKSNAYFDTSTLLFNLKLRKQLYLSYQYNWHARTTHYADPNFSTVKSYTNEQLLMLSYKF